MRRDTPALRAAKRRHDERELVRFLEGRTLEGWAEEELQSRLMADWLAAGDESIRFQLVMLDGCRELARFRREQGAS